MQVSGGSMSKVRVYEVAKDGTSLNYSITDQEVYRVAPGPATKWFGQTVASTPQGPFK